jgi:hypothetical protein
MNARLVFPALLFCWTTVAAAAEAFGPVATESRDASAAYILTQNFVIGRTARDCFPLLERADTPKSFEAAWQQRNARYMNAAKTYLNRRLAEAESKSGSAGMQRVAAALSAAIAHNGGGAVADMIGKDDKQAACRKVIGLMEAGAFDIDQRSPMFGEIQALLNYAGGG